MMWCMRKLMGYHGKGFIWLNNSTATYRVMHISPPFSFRTTYTAEPHSSVSLLNIAHYPSHKRTTYVWLHVTRNSELISFKCF